MTFKPQHSELLDTIISPEALDHGEYVVVDYRLSPGPGLSVDEAAVQLALMTSFGTCPSLPFEEHASRNKSGAKVVAIDRGDRASHVRIAYPLNLCEPNVGLAQLIAVISLGAEYDFVENLWVDDFVCSAEFLQYFPGPRWGIHGVRDILGVADRPILGVIVKPRSGASLNAISEQAYAAMIGGADFVIDDELVSDPIGEHSALERVKALANAAKKAADATHEKKAYIANVSASPLRALGLAVRAQGFGAKGVLLNAYSMGISALEELSADEDIHVPIFTSNMGWAMLSRTKNATGISETVMAKLSRIAGADGVYSGIVGSTWYSDSIFRQSLSALRRPMHTLRESFPIIAGGLSPLNVLDNLSVQGKDVIVQAGSAILRHPSGAKHGAQAFRLIMDSFCPNASTEENDETLSKLGEKHACVREILTAHRFRTKRG